MSFQRPACFRFLWVRQHNPKRDIQKIADHEDARRVAARQPEDVRRREGPDEERAAAERAGRRSPAPTDSATGGQ